jgi:hypothetical protein
MSGAEFPMPPGADPSRPSVARMYDYYLDGKDNFQIDRDAVAVEPSPARADAIRSEAVW